MAETGGISNEFAVLGGLALAAIGALGGVYAVLSHYSARKDADTTKLLDTKAIGEVAREDMAAALRQNSLGDRYLAILGGGLTRLERFYGPRRGRYALLLSMAIALAYSWAIFFLLWGIRVVENDLLGQHVLNPVGARQLLLGLILAVMPPCLFFFFRWWISQLIRWPEARWPASDNRSAKWLQRIGLGAPPGFLFLSFPGFLFFLSMTTNETSVGPFAVAFSAVYFAVGLSILSYFVAVAVSCAVAVSGAIAFAVATAVSCAVAVSGVIAIAVAITGASTGNVAVAGAFAGAVAIAGAVAGTAAAAVAEEVCNGGRVSMPEIGGLAVICGVFAVGFGLVNTNAEQAILFIAFMLVLPLANGFFDYASLWASRWFGGHLLTQAAKEERQPGTLAFWVALHMLGDLIAAAVTLAGLAFTLTFIMQGISHARGYGFDVLGEISRAAANWYTDGLWLTALLFSTLLPTLAHMMALLFSGFSLRGPQIETREKWAAQIESPTLNPKMPDSVRLANKLAEWQNYGQGFWPCLLSFLGTALLLGCFAWGLHAIGIAPATAIAAVAGQGVAAADHLRDLFP